MTSSKNINQEGLNLTLENEIKKVSQHRMSHLNDLI